MTEQLELFRNPLVIYHAGCADGYAAAWVVSRRFNHDVELLPASYGDPIPANTRTYGRQVFVVDFSYSRVEMDELERNSAQLTVLDHHKTAEENLRGAPYATFDMNKSGCGLAWDYLFPTEERPEFINYVEDRDLWKFELRESREIALYISTVPHTTNDFDMLASCDGYEMSVMAQGCKKYVDYMCRDAVQRSKLTRFWDYRARVICSAYIGISEMLNELLLQDDCDIAVGWYVKDGTMRVSLRSTDVDVSQLARVFGGGGHHRAAGFSVDVNSLTAKDLLRST